MAATSGKRRSFITDLDHLRKCFNAVDHPKSGFIGLEELTKLVDSMPGTGDGDSVVAELMEKLDRDNDGKVSFDDFVWLFELEQESTSKKQKLNPLDLNDQSEASVSPSASPSENLHIESSPTSPNEMSYGEGVVLRRNPRRMTMPARLNRHGRDLSLLSPISAYSSAGKRPPSNDLTDLASQMKYLTEASESIDSPQLKRGSKVLSWIESEDLLFEDTGTGLRGREELPSPPVSPTHGNDEASQIGSILESVCNSREVSSVAIAKLCDHVKADPQEQQELIALLHHLDKDSKGYVSTTEFAQGLQAIKNSVAVASMTPTHQTPLRKGFRETTPPRLSEPFGTPQGTKPPLSSTPMAPSTAANILTANQSGYMKVDDIVTYWQKIGIETPHDKSLEDILTETVPADPSGRINVGDLTETLEGSILTDGKSQNVLRQVALKSYKNEITTLRTQVHQVSMERDKLKTSLNRTMEEKSKLITEGDEHVEMITKKSEKEKRRQQSKYFERIKEVEKTKQEESLQLQERAAKAIKDLEARMMELKGEEEKLREDLKFANEEVVEMTQQLASARKEIGKKERTIAILQKDLGSRSEHDIIDDESHMLRVNELENEVSEKIALISELQEKLREIRDNCDELKAENERMRHKNIAHKRSMQKSFSVPNTRNSSAKRRPLSGSHFHRRSIPSNPRVPTTMDLDLAVPQNHPVLQEEGQGEGEDEVDFTLPHLPAVHENLPQDDLLESGDDTTDTEDDFLAKSSASLMEEMHQEKLATLERKRDTRLDIQQRKHEEIVTQLKQEIFRLEEFSESQQEQALKMEEEKSLADKRLKELKYEIESERKSHEVEVNILSRKLENAENDMLKLDQDLKRVTEEQKLSQDDYKAELLKAEKEAESEISALQSKLLHAKGEQSSLQSERFAQIKERLETQKKDFVRKSSDALAKLEGKHKEQTKAIKSKHKATVETLHKELRACEQKVKNLTDKLNSDNRDLEAKINQLHDLQIKEAAYKIKISGLETSDGQYANEVSDLQANVTKLQTEISHMKSAAIAYKNRISNLKSELQKDSEFDDCSSLQSSSRRTSTSSESSKEIFTMMKVQLEELQKVLESKSVNDRDDSKHKFELELIDRLTSALDAELQKMRQGISAERLTHVQVCSQKDKLLCRFQTEKETQSKLFTSLVTDTSKDFVSQIDSLQNSCSVSLVKFKSQLDEALRNLESISRSLVDSDLRHTSALDALFSDLSRYEAEISELQQELETSHHTLDELNESQEQFQRDRDKEMQELQSKLEQALKRKDSLSSERISTRHIKVDAGSGQVISDQDESPTRHQELLQKEKIIRSQAVEIEQLKQAERHANITTEEANRKLLEKEREVKRSKLEVESLHRKAQELELKLEQQAHEADKYKDEIVTLKKSLSASEDLRTTNRLLQHQHEQSLKEIEEKHASELRSVQEVVAKNASEARELYNYLLDSSATSTKLVPEYATELNHSQTITETKKEVDIIMEQFIEQQRMYIDLEAVLAGRIEEHELMEAQFTAEHEEEVRALRQQKRHVMKQLEELQQHYQNILDDQEQQSDAMLQELINSKADVEKQLKEKTEESFHTYQQVADLGEEKKVLVDIIKQLCLESGRHIDVV